MATLQHTIETHSSHRLVYAALLALVAAAAVTIILVASNGSTSTGAVPVSTFSLTGTPQQQLEAVSGPRVGTRPFHAAVSPQQQLEAVSGARFGVSRGNR